MRTIVPTLAGAVALATVSAHAAPLSPAKSPAVELSTAPPIELVRDDCGHGWHRTGWRDYWGYWHWGDCVPNGKSASWLERGPGLLAWSLWGLGQAGVG
jgi:hypothetical protein